MEMERFRVLFPFVEAGFGHIMPTRSVLETFERKYGDRVEVVPSHFFTETGNRHMIRYEQMLARQVRIYNRFPLIGHFATFCCGLFGSTLSSLGSMFVIGPVACVRSVAHMKELDCDMVVSTHWSTNYYAEHLKKKPFTVMYCPDARLNRLFEYRADLNMISMPYGYQKALRKRRYNVNNMKLVPFLIRNEAFAVPPDKQAARERLGIPRDNFTVLLAEGGYGIGKMAAICRRLAGENIPLTLIPVCGKNEKLYRQLCALSTGEGVTLRPYAFADNMFELHAASDLFCGKSGNMLAESTFFGNPSVVTNCSNHIERHIADHYIHSVGCTVKQLSAKKTAEMIRTFVGDPSLLDPLRRAALDYHSHFGSEQAADELWQAILRIRPDLSE